MRICNTLNSNEQKYCLSQSKYFNSIEELVQNYQHYSLRENFERLKENTMLEWPYRQLLAVVLEDFEPQDRSQLRLRAGDQIVIIGKEGYREGWWRAKSRNGVSQCSCHYLSLIIWCGEAMIELPAFFYLFFRLVTFQNIAFAKNRKYYMM